jgi:hypothetical protein
MRKEWRGASPVLTLSAGITAISASFQVTGEVASWPTGITDPFVVTVARGQANEEKMLCRSLSGSNPATIAVLQRGWDDTPAQTHATFETVEHTLDSDSLTEYHDHIYDQGRDDHQQYIPDDGTRGFSGLTAIAGTPVSVGTANTPGTSLLLARADHHHDINDGAIDHAALFAAGAVDLAALAPNSVDASKIVDASVGTAELADNSVNAAKLADNAVDTAAIQALAVTGAKVAASTLSPDKMVAVEQFDIQVLVWSQRTTDGNLMTITIPAVPFKSQIIPSIVMMVNPNDSPAYDAQITLSTGTGGTGTLLGKGGFRNNGVNSREQVLFPCDPLALAANIAQTLYLAVNYSSASPTTGFTASGVGDNKIRTRYLPVP